MIEILRSQEKIVDGFACNSVGYLNPTWYSFRQFNTTFNSVASITGGIRILLSSTAGLGVNTKVRVSGSLYSGIEVGNILAVVNNVSIDVEGIVFIGNDVGWITNVTLFRNLHVETQLLVEGAGAPQFQNPSLNNNAEFWFQQKNSFSTAWVTGAGFITCSPAAFFGSDTFYQPFPMLSGQRIRVIGNVTTAGSELTQMRIVDASGAIDSSNQQTLSAGAFDFELILNRDVSSPGIQLFISTGTVWTVRVDSIEAIISNEDRTISKAPSLWFARPNTTGIIDIQSEVKSLLYSRESVGYETPFYKFSSSSIFKVQYREVYWDVLNVKQIGAWVSIDEEVLGVPGRRQIQQEFGNNMIDYAIRVAADGTVKFLTLFNRPTIWGDIPSLLGFIVDANSPVTATSFRTQWFNNQGVQLGGNITTNLGVLTPGTYIFLTLTPPVNAAYSIVFAHVTGNAAQILAGKITLDVVEFCLPSIMLEWQNSLGGFSQHVFQRRQQLNLGAAEDKDISQQYDPDIENSLGNLFRDGTGIASTLTLFDEFALTNDIPYLHEVKTSRQVRIIFEGGVAIFCVPIGTDSSFRNRTKFTPFTVTVKLPDNFNPILIDPNLG